MPIIRSQLAWAGRSTWCADASRHGSSGRPPSYTPRLVLTSDELILGRSRYERHASPLARAWCPRLVIAGSIVAVMALARPPSPSPSPSPSRPPASGVRPRPRAPLRAAHAGAAGGYHLPRLRRRNHGRPVADDQHRAVEAVVRRRPLVGSALRTDDEPARHLHAGSKTQVWADTGTLIDERPVADTDMLSVGTQLWAVSGGSRATDNHAIRVRRFSYDAKAKRYLARPRFPGHDPAHRCEPRGHRRRLEGHRVGRLHGRAGRSGSPTPWRGRRPGARPSRSPRRRRRSMRPTLRRSSRSVRAGSVSPGRTSAQGSTSRATMTRPPTPSGPPSKASCEVRDPIRS